MGEVQDSGPSTSSGNVGPSTSSGNDGEESYDPTGLGLARSIAQSVGATARKKYRKRPERQVVEPRSSGAHPDDRDPKTLASAFEQLVDSRGWSTEISVHTLLARWSTLVGPTNAAHSRPEAYSDGVVTVSADSTVWATSLRTMAPQLVAILNEQLGQGTVKRVKVNGPKGPSWKKGPLSVRDGRGPRDTYG